MQSHLQRILHDVESDRLATASGARCALGYILLLAVRGIGLIGAGAGDLFVGHGVVQLVALQSLESEYVAREGRSNGYGRGRWRFLGNNLGNSD